MNKIVGLIDKRIAKSQVFYEEFVNKRLGIRNYKRCIQYTTKTGGRRKTIISFWGERDGTFRINIKDVSIR